MGVRQKIHAKGAHRVSFCEDHPAMVSAARFHYRSSGAHAKNRLMPLTENSPGTKREWWQTPQGMNSHGGRGAVSVFKRKLARALPTVVASPVQSVRGPSKRMTLAPPLQGSLSRRQRSTVFYSALEETPTAYRASPTSPPSLSPGLSYSSPTDGNRILASQGMILFPCHLANYLYASKGFKIIKMTLTSQL